MVAFGRGFGPPSWSPAEQVDICADPTKPRNDPVGIVLLIRQNRDTFERYILVVFFDHLEVRFCCGDAVIEIAGVRREVNRTDEAGVAVRVVSMGMGGDNRPHSPPLQLSGDGLPEGGVSECTTGSPFHEQRVLPAGD